MTRVYVGVGASIEARANILRAVDSMAKLTDVTGVSTFYQTPALERPGDPDFVNGALEVDTTLDPIPFKATLLRLLEDRADRERTSDPYAPRSLDLDILVHGQHVIDEPTFQLPDPAIYTRRFVAGPLHELAPDLLLPGSGTPLVDVLAETPTSPMTPLPAFTRKLCSVVSTRPPTREHDDKVPRCNRLPGTRPPEGRASGPGASPATSD